MKYAPFEEDPSAQPGGIGQTARKMVSFFGFVDFLGLDSPVGRGVEVVDFGPVSDLGWDLPD